MERKLRELREENRRLEQRAAACQAAGPEESPEGEAADPMADYNKKRSKLAASESSLRETLGEGHAAVREVQKELEELEKKKPPLSRRSAEKKAAALERKLERIEKEAKEAERAAEEQRAKHETLSAQAAEIREEIRVFELQHGKADATAAAGGGEQAMLQALGLTPADIDKVPDKEAKILQLTNLVGELRAATGAAAMETEEVTPPVESAGGGAVPKKDEPKEEEEEANIADFDRLAREYVEAAAAHAAAREAMGKDGKDDERGEKRERDEIEVNHNALRDLRQRMLKAGDRRDRSRSPLRHL